ncbi:MAG TPA: phosphate ABC transporter permease PstA [Gammaproteobacteria bacterium]|nr:phosphate ABC transporter permease PstA [Gammaproteobacteria bacterium]
MNNTEIVKRGLGKRYAREKRFRLYGRCAVFVGFIFLALLLVDIIVKAMPAFSVTEIRVEVDLDRDNLGLPAEGPVTAKMLAGVNFNGAIRKGLREAFPEATSRKQQKALYSLVSSGAWFSLSNQVADNPQLIGQKKVIWFRADDDVDTYYKLGRRTSRIDDLQAGYIDAMDGGNLIRTAFNTALFTNSDSREPEQAGIRGAVMGSFWTLLVTLIVSLPVGVAAAIYLEEYAPQNRLTDFIEININNLAAVPSIVFGLLGLAVFINFFGMPRSAPIVGGLVLSLMTLPTIIIASRAAIKSVPPSIKEAALGIGASHMQVVFHHTLPLAMPGILTGSIIGMAQALGESAPLLMIGMVAFIVDVPGGIFDSATVLPVQIYLWSDSPERAFTALTAATILVLLVFLTAMNAIAIYLRRKFERRW